jgi:thymidine phosphorylase
MTASLSSSSVLDALAKGAAGSLLRCKFGERAGNLLYLEDLGDRLAVVSRARFGSLDFLPQLDQLRLDDSAHAIDLSHRLNLPANRESVGKLICRMFPDAARVVPTKVVGSGKSDAQATFFAHSEVEDDKRATRFIKIGPWLSILREANACEKVIKPRLGSHVATVIGAPCFSGEPTTSSWMGALQYSTVGPPERQDRLRSLSDILEAARQGMEPKFPRTVVKETLEHVLRPLHESGQKKSAPVSIVKYLGLSLPPLVTGELTAANANAIDIAPAISLNLKPDAAAVLDASVWQDLRNRQRPVCRVLGPLDEVVWPTSDEPGNLTILHPTLGYRIRVRAGLGPFVPDLKREWLRPGLPVRLTFKVDQEEVRGLTLPSKDLAKHTEMSLDGTPAKHRKMIMELAEVFSFSRIPLFLFEKITLGSTHGDLNLQNILVSGAKTEIGWLIDFDRARVNGMVANDCAKLEVEIWNHYLIPALIGQCSGFAGAKSAMSDCVDLINCIIGAVNHNPYRPSELVRATSRHTFLDDPSIVAPLEAIGAVRAYSRDVLKLSVEELSWAIAAYAFTSCKFLRSKQPRERTFLSAYLSAKTIQSVLPSDVSRRNSQVSFQGDSTRKRATLIRIASGPYDSGTMKKVALAIKASTEVLPPWSREDPQRWDFASTGSVANITPIWGYLCLMVARTAGSGHLVTKISSAGNSCGTVDILESAGLRFPSRPHEIVETAKGNGGVLCKPGKWLAPLDKELMSLRKESNTMKSPTLVLASILGKKLALGCTHAILDVKVGKDSKVTSPRTEHRLSLPATDLHSLLRGVFGNSFQHDKDALYVRSKPRSLPPGLQELRWIATSSDVPQCRAVGRRLILIQIDKMIESGLSALPEQYRNLYGRVMPSVCSPQAAAVPGDFLAALRSEWTTLRSQFGLREWDIVRRLAEYIDAVESPGAGDTPSLPSGLEAYTFTSDRKGRVTTINAYALDILFEELTTRGPTYDFDVGIWLHRLPGEESERGKPLFTIFYRYAKQDKRAVQELGRRLNQEIAYDN